MSSSASGLAVVRAIGLVVCTKSEFAEVLPPHPLSCAMTELSEGQFNSIQF
jgi:hypothetical protein